MLVARGRKFSREEFIPQINRSFRAVKNDIFSGEEYEAHKARLLAMAQENTTLKNENANLKAQLQNQTGSGLDQTTINTINETNTVAKAIKATLDALNTFLRSIFRGTN